MSTYVGLKCHTCDESTGCDASYYALPYLASLSRRAEVIVTAFIQMGEDAPDEVGWYWWSGNSLVMFLTEHRGHDVRPFDEYGYDYDSQGEKITRQ